MRIVLALCFCLGLVAVGCASNKAGKGSPEPQNGVSAAGPGKVVIAPEKSLSGNIVKVNPNGRFVVISFPPGPLPALERVFLAYRQGYKVAEVKISGPQLDDNIVADVISGEPQVGDQIREN